MLSEYQRKALKLLLTQYEKSKTYTGQNNVTQSFSTVPEKVFAEYTSDFADVNLVRDFENQMCELENNGLIVIIWDRLCIKRLTANPARLEEYYHILHQTPKREAEAMQIEMYKDYLGISALLDSFCNEQIDRLQANKKANFDMEDAKVILKLCEFILRNQTDILERELSIAVLGDSKKWEKSYRSAVCRVLRKYGNFDNLLLGVSNTNDNEDKREVQRILLAEYHVYANPSYVYFKGNAKLTFDDGRTMLIKHGEPMAFSTDTLNHLNTIHIADTEVMTIENLTSFNRVSKDNTFMIFLSGYHNTAKQKMIRKIYDSNSQLRWYHFGDIDPDGFYIVENLKRGTGIDFEPVHMDTETLEKYKDYAKPLTANDKRKAQTLLQNEMYTDTVKYMLDKDIKLEQEIVSWLER